jgi:hypothetical protein
MMVVWPGLPVLVLPAWRLVTGDLAAEAGRVLPPVLSWLTMLLAAPCWVACLVGDLPGGFWWRGVTARPAGTSVA